MLHYRVTGKQDAPSIFFLHGFLASGAEWDPIIAPLRHEFRCVAVDLPGHGRSVGLTAEDAYTMGGASRALDDLMTELRLERCGIVGYSMGGRLALHFTLRHPHRCNRLVLESASPGLQDDVEREARRGVDEARAARLESGDFDQFLDAWYGQPLFASLGRRPDVREQVLASRRHNDPAELATSLRGMGAGVQSPLWDRLADLTVPTLYVAGALDGKYVEVAERFALLGDHVRTAVFPNAGHNVHVEYPDEFADLLRDFFHVPG